MKRMFKSALIKLTLWYASIAILLSLLFSVVLYHFAAVELREGLHSQYITMTANDHDADNSTGISSQDFRERAGMLYLHLVYFNAIVLVLSSTGSYFLARRTLRPIKEAHEAQIRFTAHASHELRTPLSAIRADTESVLLTKTDDVDLYKKTLRANLRDVNRMEELASHLLNAARFRYEKPSKEPVDLLQLLHSAIKDIKRSNPTKKVNMKLTGDHVRIVADPIAIKQLILSLLDNAIKYGDGKTVDIAVIKTGKFAVITVLDFGPGIKQSDLKHIFEPFYRSDHKKHQKSGFGLGLALAREIAVATGGSITADNQAGGGAIFTVRLPLA